MSPLEKLCELAAAEIDWPEFCRLAQVCFPAKTGEAAARHVLEGAGHEVLQWIAAFEDSPRVPAARKVRDTAERYRAVFKEKWAAGEFDIEEVRGYGARVVPAEGEPAVIKPKAIDPPPPSKPSKPGPKQGSGKLAGADRNLFPEIRERLGRGETVNAITLALVDAKCVSGNAERASLARRLRNNFLRENRDQVGINSKTDN